MVLPAALYEPDHCMNTSAHHHAITQHSTLLPLDRHGDSTAAMHHR
jgi:hypothetical protein